MKQKKRQSLPGREFLAKQLAQSGFEMAQSRKVVSEVVRAMGLAIAQGGFEIRGFAVLTVENGARRVKRNPRTGEVLRDNDGQPIYGSGKRVKVKLSKGVL